ncbi:MAG: ferrochelatase, partial [Halobacteria archaeon]|nr:ferrochelatase [Halobacteria archaeon]
LLEEYDEMGPSPLVPQARHQAEMLETELVSRGYDVETYNGMQYTEPFIREAVEEARDDGVEKLIGIPVYPLCGRTTTVESLEFLSEEVEEMGWDVSYQEITGWHEHPKYVELRTDNLRSYVESEGIDLNDDEATLLFSAHGTPIKYLREGSRYDEYVEEFCSWVADDVGVEDYLIGYQNHANRDDVDWTQPETEEVVEEVEGDRVVVEPLSFMHEQSETLSELDIELREECEEMGLEMHRVPVPHDDPR